MSDARVARPFVEIRCGNWCTSETHTLLTALTSTDIYAAQVSFELYEKHVDSQGAVLKLTQSAVLCLLRIPAVQAVSQRGAMHAADIFSTTVLR